MVAAYPAIEDELDEDGEVVNNYVRTDLYYSL
eukprot:SAG11_NODE_523_length_8775_cov_29.592900_8_plen_32_part_00